MTSKNLEKEKQLDFEKQRDSAEGKITPEGLAAMRARIGIVQPVSRYGEPSPRPGHEYASIDGMRAYSEGIGDPNPLYTDPEYAARTRWGKMIAHPTFILYMGVPQKKELTAEERRIGRAGGLAGVHAMYGGEEVEWFRPILEGDRLTCKTGLARVEEKESKTAGFAVHETGESVLWNQRGELVGVRRSLLIRYERTASRERRTHLDVPPPKYTPEDLAKIDADYEREERRGSNPRYWEDVTVGEEIVPVVKGPWRVTDYIVYCEGTGHRNTFHSAHKLAYEYRKRHPRAFPLTENGYPDVITRVHWDPAMAHITGEANCYDYGGERVGNVSHAATNWMGDDGFLRKFQIQIRGFVRVGDTYWVKGRVAEKYVKDGEHFVELELHSVNQRGEDVAPARAWVLLPSRVNGPVKIPARIPEKVSIYA
jgi:acyl dehydratase